MLRLRINASLRPLTTFAVGGRARRLLTVREPDELVQALTLARVRGWRYQLIAGGSNVVFSDRILSGLIIHFVPKVKPCLWQGLTLTVEANQPLAALVKTATRRGLGGLEKLSGIPGTVGGAIVGNAGAYGQGISDCLSRVEILDARRPNGIHWLTKKQCCFAYRDSVFKRKNWFILRAEFKLKTGERKQLAVAAAEIIKTREKKYHPGLRCPGSFFKNVLVRDLSPAVLKKIDPEKIIAGKIPAGYLLEQVGANGMKFGGLRIADYHGNLLINAGGATYRQVRALAAKLKKLVKSKFGIILEEEVRYLS